MSLFTVSLVLFLIMDPVGNIGAYLSLMRGIAPVKQRWILLREMGIAFMAMILFNYLGEVIFDLLEISQTTVCLASGVILFLIAIKILFLSNDSLRANLPKGEPFITPLAIPLIAGPSLLATIMLYANLEPSQPLMLTAIALATLASFSVLLASPYLNRFFGNSGLLALEKLMGMILVLLAVQRFTDGVQHFFAVHVQ
jgi:multiple antibiotic resistance protein